ncbi:MAG: pyruvate kinase [Flammeovirgaceae bacterium]|jgi:pyruvate kinase
MNNFFNKTKIIATVGPASNTKEKLHELIVAGVDVFRLNFSHGTHEQHAEVIKHIKELNQAFNYNVSILQDLQGPKIRLGEMENGGFDLNEGDELRITTEKVLGKPGKVSCSYTALTKDVKAGDMIMMDDGKLQVRVFKVEPHEVHTEVIYGGFIKPRKGMNLPDTDISEPSLTKKDKRDLEFGLKSGVDWVAISFVRTPGDVIDLRNIINDHGYPDVKIISKIERPEAIKNIDEIIEQTDAIMVARGDLGVEILMEDVPVEQKRIIRKSNIAAKPVIVATQMMESMIENPRPTRAEANDVANAVMDGADAVMLSGETAAGKYPVEVIQAMTKIIRAIEQNVSSIYNKFWEPDSTDQDFGSITIVNSACRIAKVSNAKAIIGMTSSGFTAFGLSRCRSEANVFIFTANKKLLSQLNLVWGVRGFYYNKFDSTDKTFADIEEILVREGHLRKGDVFINTASMPIGAKKRTNVVKFNIVN